MTNNTEVSAASLKAKKLDIMSVTSVIIPIVLEL
jgi:hypothetical protein